MRRRIIWTLLSLVLAAPAVWAGSAAAGCCPIAACCDRRLLGVSVRELRWMQARAPRSSGGCAAWPKATGSAVRGVFTASVARPSRVSRRAPVCPSPPRRKTTAQSALLKGLFCGQPSSNFARRSPGLGSRSTKTAHARKAPRQA